MNTTSIIQICTSLILLFSSIYLIYHFIINDTENFTPGNCNCKTLDNNNDNKNDNNKENYKVEKIIHYYGGKYCPHSKENSNMYNLINNILKSKYENLKINIYWTDVDKDKFIENNVMYVPTIKNNNGKDIFIGLPEGTDVKQYNDKQLEEMLLRNIYNQL